MGGSGGGMYPAGHAAMYPMLHSHGFVSTQDALKVRSECDRRNEISPQLPCVATHNPLPPSPGVRAAFLHAIRSERDPKATEHGNSDVLAAYLHAGGDPTACSRLHHMAWSLLHLATGCATAMGGVASSYRTRPEPDCPNGFATCVSLLMAAGADPNVLSKQVYDHSPARNMYKFLF